MPKAQSSRYFPTPDKLGSARDLQAVFKQVLQQHYHLQDQFEKYKTENPPQAKRGPSPENGPANTKICGLFVSPVDVSTLADGATLKFDKKNGVFKFS